jgi:hypothetical protein
MDKALRSKPGDALRFADILTTASSVANYLGEPAVTAAHLAAAVAVLLGETRVEDLGRPRSPLGRSRQQAGATGEVRAFVQRWFEALGSADATIEGEMLRMFREEVRIAEQPRKHAGREAPDSQGTVAAARHTSHRGEDCGAGR